MDITKELFPEAFILEEIDDMYQSTLIDAELDPFKIHFHGDNCVQIMVGDTWITLGEDELNILSDMIVEAEYLYNKKNKK